jgi:tight adherence protein C
VELLAPLLIFAAIMAGGVVLSRRPSRTVEQLTRHQIAAVPGGATVAPREPRVLILGGMRRTSSIGGLAMKTARRQVKSKSAKLLLEAGNPLPLGTFLLLRSLTFGAVPLVALQIIKSEGLSPLGILLVAMTLIVFPNLPTMMIKRKARKRTRAIDMAMPDAMDVLVVCVEGGLSLDGGLQQVGERTDGVLAAELRRLQSEIATGMGRREAFQGLAARSQSQSLSIFATAMVQADKMGTSIASTLRTLTETMRVRRRQQAETQARKAPTKMLPFLVIFMLPSLFIVILGPVVLAMIDFFGTISG